MAGLNMKNSIKLLDCNKYTDCLTSYDIKNKDKCGLKGFRLRWKIFENVSGIQDAQMQCVM